MMFFPIFDPTMILLIPALIFAFWAQSKVKSTYKRYSGIHNSAGLSGREVARQILDQSGLYNVEIEAVAGTLSDHYDPVKEKVRLSEQNYNSTSLAALAVAAHEVGHAVQHSEGYSALRLRHSLVGPVNFSSMLAFPRFLIGLFLANPTMMDIGIIFFSLAVVFHLVTLPVEFDASKRAILVLNQEGYLDPKETAGAKKVLDAAAWTYVAAAAMSMLQLVRFVMLRGMFGGND